MVFLVVLIYSGIVYESGGFFAPFWLVDDPATNDLAGIVNIFLRPGVYITHMAVIGGMESLLGAAIGAFLSRFGLEMLREINILGFHLELGAWRYAAFGLLLMFTLRFAQNGLLYPIIDRLFMRRAREETVAKRVQETEVES